MSEFLVSNDLSREERIALLKKLLKDMDKGLITPEEIKERFKKILSKVHPVEIAIIENALIKEGFPIEKIHNLCGVHIDIFKESLENEKNIAKKGHPIYLLMDEHRVLLSQFTNLRELVEALKGFNSFQDAKNIIEDLRKVTKVVNGVKSHMLREENVLFPYLEKHEIIQPAKIMWTEHDSLRLRLKELNTLLSSPENEPYKDFVKHIDSLILYIIDLKSNHIYKENKILFPSAINKLTEEEWNECWEQMDEMGYGELATKEAIEHKIKEAPVHPTNYDELLKKQINSLIETARKAANYGDEKVHFEYGALTKEQLSALLDLLPVDITFVDDKDTVRYFNKATKRVFPRTKAVIGRTVQNCHPPKSVHIVEKILSDFKTGKRDYADFWLEMKSRFIYIKYYAVRDMEGKYLGTLEVTQDVTEIRKLQGEKRIYSEE